MAKIRICKCNNCGAAINLERMICEYCGATYKKEYDPLEIEPRIVIARPGVKTYRVMSKVPLQFMEHFTDDEIMLEVRRDMVLKIAEAIAEEIDIEREMNFLEMGTVYRATVRVVDPSFRF